MEKTKKDKLLIIVLIILPYIGFMTFGALYFIVQDKNSELQVTIDQQNTLLKDVNKRDSIFTENNKHYSDVIKQYDNKISNCTVTVGKKDYSLNQFVDLFVKSENDKYKFQDSLRQYKEAVESLNKKASELLRKDKRFNDSLKRIPSKSN